MLSAADLGSVAWGARIMSWGRIAQTCKYKCSLWFFWVLFSNGKHCICTVVVGLYHYTNIMIPLLLHSNFNISTFNNLTFYLLLSICHHLISITDTIGLRQPYSYCVHTIHSTLIHYTCCSVELTKSLFTFT